jgi:chemotaxis protein CheY-P-specific phosphatase CheC
MSRADVTPIVRPVLDRLLGHATARAGEVLTEMSGRPIRVAATGLSPYPGRAADGLAGLDRAMVGVRVGLAGAFVGRALFSLALASARRLSAILLEGLDGARPEGPAALGPLAMSAIEEVGNVTVTAVANALSAHLGGPIDPSVPRTEVGHGGDLLDAMVRDMTDGGDGVLVAQITFIDDRHDIEAMLLVVSDPTSLGRAETVKECCDG